MLSYHHPVMHRRQLLGLSLADIQSQLAGYGFNYSIEMLQAIENGERRFPLENPGFVVAMSHCLKMPVAHLWYTARQAAELLRAHTAFRNRVQRLRPQNQMLLNFVLKHPLVTDIPGFDLWFDIVKSVLLRMPDSWFSN